MKSRIPRANKDAENSKEVYILSIYHQQSTRGGLSGTIERAGKPGKISFISAEQLIEQLSGENIPLRETDPA